MILFLKNGKVLTFRDCADVEICGGQLVLLTDGGVQIGMFWSADLIGWCHNGTEFRWLKWIEEGTEGPKE